MNPIKALRAVWYDDGDPFSNAGLRFAGCVWLAVIAAPIGFAMGWALP